MDLRVRNRPSCPSPPSCNEFGSSSRLSPIPGRMVITSLLITPAPTRHGSRAGPSTASPRWRPWPWRQGHGHGPGVRAERQAQALQGAWRGRFGARTGPAGASCGLPRAQPAEDHISRPHAGKSEDKIIHGFFLSLYVIKIAGANERNIPKKGEFICLLHGCNSSERIVIEIVVIEVDGSRRILDRLATGLISN